MSNNLITDLQWDELTILVEKVIDCLGHDDVMLPTLVIKEYLGNMKEKEAVQILLRDILRILYNVGVKDKNLDNEALQEQFSNLCKKPDNVTSPNTQLDKPAPITYNSGTVFYNSDFKGDFNIATNDKKLKEEIEMKTRYLSEANQKTKEQEKSILQLNSEAENYRKEIKDLQNKINNLQTELSDKKYKLNDLYDVKNLNIMLTNNNGQLLVQVQNCTKEKEELDKEKSTVLSKNKELEEENNRLKLELVEKTVNDIPCPYIS